MSDFVVRFAGGVRYCVIILLEISIVKCVSRSDLVAICGLCVFLSMACISVSLYSSSFSVCFVVLLLFVSPMVCFVGGFVSSVASHLSIVSPDRVFYFPSCDMYIDSLYPVLPPVGSMCMLSLLQCVIVLPFVPSILKYLLIM